MLAGTLRAAIVAFERTASATVAHNCVHGAHVSPSAINSETFTRLTTAYERPVKPHLVRDWLASHPRVVFPVILFLLGTLTYTVGLSRLSSGSLLTAAQVFDPIRAVAVQAKVMDWLDFRGKFPSPVADILIVTYKFSLEFALTKWIRRNTLERFTMGFNDTPFWDDSGGATDTTAWKDRQEAESTLTNYLFDYPCPCSNILRHPVVMVTLATLSSHYQLRLWTSRERQEPISPLHSRKEQ